MAYQTVPTVNTGDYWSAVNHNTYVRDNFAASIPGLFAAKGDLALGAGAAAAERFAAGSDYSTIYAKAAEATGVRRAPLSEQILVYYDPASPAYTVTGSTWSDIPNASLQYTPPFTAYGFILATGNLYAYTPPGFSKTRLYTDGIVSPENLYYTTHPYEVWYPFCLLQYQGFNGGTTYTTKLQGYSDNGARIKNGGILVIMWKVT